MFKKVNIKLLIVSVVACFLLVSCEQYDREIKARSLLEQCKALELGMSRSEVIGIMGEPLRTIVDEDKKENLYFLSGRVSSTQTQCVIDKETDFVEKIICGEDYK